MSGFFITSLTPQLGMFYITNFMFIMLYTYYYRYQARVAYIRTCAVMSIVGYILGLGDRHGENILFDSTNGDCVHVDFNCLFNRVIFILLISYVTFAYIVGRTIRCTRKSAFPSHPQYGSCNGKYKYTVKHNCYITFLGGNRI